MREQETFTTPGGFEVTVYSYITGREARDVQAVYLEGITFQVSEGGATKSNEISAAITSKVQDKLIESLVVSVNKSTEGVLEKVLNLPKKDFDEVIRRIDAISAGLSEQKKTK